MKKLRCETSEGFREGDRPRGRFVTPADFLHQDCGPSFMSTYAARVWAFSLVSGGIFCRPLPNPELPDSQLLQRRCVTTALMERYFLLLAESPHLNGVGVGASGVRARAATL